MQDAACELRYNNADEIELIFNNPQWAVTPGQSVVIYDENYCLGGGIIK
jgi:tRNA-specific 2-thiouridylase